MQLGVDDDSPDDATQTAEQIVAATVSTEELGGSEEQLLSQAAANGPQYLFLDSVALNLKYKAIFGADNPRGDSSYNWSLAKPDIFFPDERAKLGTFNLRSDKVAEQNALWMSGITQDYVAVVRKFLAGSCKKLATAEYDDGVVDDNKIVKGLTVTAPSAEAVSDVMSLFFGYSLPGGALHDGATAYQAVFAANVSDWSAANPNPYGSLRRSFIINQYTLLCMSIGQDLRALMR
jgi:hypothetical protein